MPGKNLLLTTIHGQTASRAVIAGGGKVTAIADAQYLLQMSDERTARDNIIVKRAGDDLQIFIDGIDEPNLTLENFYGDEIHAQLCNVDADGQIHAYLRTDGLGSDGHLLLADGESAPLFLGDPALGVMPEAIGATTDHAAAIPLWPYLAGAAAIGAAGSAYHHHTQGSGNRHAAPSGSGTTPPALPTEWSADRWGASGKAEAGSTVVLYEGGTKWAEVEVDARGDWKLTRSDPIGPGTYSFTVEVIDKAGNSSGQTEPIEFVVPPWSGKADITQVIGHTDNLQGEIAPDGLTNDARPQLVGRCSTGTVFVSIYDGTTLLGATKALSDGTWSFTPDTDLSEGPHSLTTVAFGGWSGNGEPSPAWNFTVDTTPPALPTEWSADRYGVSGKAEADSTVVIYHNSTKWADVVADKNGDWHCTFEEYSGPGTYSFTVEVIDKAGNSSGQTEPIEFVVPPWSGKADITQIIGHTDDLQGEITPDGLTNDARPQLVGRCSTGTVFVRIYDGTTLLGGTKALSDGTWSFTPDTDLSEGPHSLTTVAFGGWSGNGEPSPAWNFTVDTIPPALATDWFVDNRSGSGEAEPGSTVVAYHNGEKLIEVPVGADGKWHYTLDNQQPLGTGMHTFTVEVIDKAGNSSGLCAPLEVCVMPPPLDDDEHTLASSIAIGSTTDGSNYPINLSDLGPGWTGNITIAAERAKSTEANNDAGSPFSRSLPALQDLLTDGANNMFPMGSKSASEQTDWSARADISYPSAISTELNAILLEANASLL
ncbi:Ig-like domain-containing protein [Pseudomonas pseudonitroreducens]|uniref:Ig-like domain-containing protein n=1 Tax=Pseudomonas pseudonitroreducens TaxID=2892326 RepID=UPI001F2CF105|nr:Ig-like domain-containing protein [Pseudomonas pseudonitroreducens]